MQVRLLLLTNILVLTFYSLLLASNAFLGVQGPWNILLLWVRWKGLLGELVILIRTTLPIAGQTQHPLPVVTVPSGV